jgi:hypothetical protein
MVVPWLLRTNAYRCAMEAGGDGDSATALLDDLERRFVFVVAEAALGTWPDEPGCMVDQIAHLSVVAERPKVRLGVVPQGLVRGGMALPLHGFTVYDQAAVTVETFTRELTLTNEPEVSAYLGIFEGFEQAAVFGDEMRVLDEGIMRDYERVTRSIH